MDLSRLSNRALFYRARFVEAENAFRNEDYETSDDICSEILQNADLPLLYKAGCHVTLATGYENGIYHAREAVRLYKYMVDKVPYDEHHANLVKMAEEVLEECEDEEKERAVGEGKKGIVEASRRTSFLFYSRDSLTPTDLVAAEVIEEAATEPTMPVATEPGERAAAELSESEESLLGAIAPTSHPAPKRGPPSSSSPSTERDVDDDKEGEAVASSLTTPGPSSTPAPSDNTAAAGRSRREIKRPKRYGSDA